MRTPTQEQGTGDHGQGKRNDLEHENEEKGKIDDKQSRRQSTEAGDRSIQETRNQDRDVRTYPAFVAVCHLPVHCVLRCSSHMMTRNSGKRNAHAYWGRSTIKPSSTSPNPIE